VYPGLTLTYGALIGEYSASENVSSLNLSLKLLRHGGTGLKISNIKSSIIKVDINNSELFVPSPVIEKGIEFGSNVSDDVAIISDRPIDAPTPIVGNIKGIVKIPKITYIKGKFTTNQLPVFVEHGLIDDSIVVTATSNQNVTIKTALVDLDLDGFKERIKFSAEGSVNYPIEIYFTAEVVNQNVNYVVDYELTL